MSFDFNRRTLLRGMMGGAAVSVGLPFLDCFLNNNGTSLVDPAPYYAVDGTDRPWDLAFSGLYGFPVGRGGAVLANAHGFVGALVNDWQMEWIFQNDAGTPVGYPNGENFNCGNYNLRSPQKSYKSYLNNSQSSCFSTFTEYTPGGRNVNS